MFSPWPSRIHPIILCSQLERLRVGAVKFRRIVAAGDQTLPAYAAVRAPVDAFAVRPLLSATAVQVNPGRKDQAADRRREVSMVIRRAPPPLSHDPEIRWS